MNKAMNCELCNKEKTWNGSEPRCAFKNGDFDNWNCGLIGELRNIAGSWVDPPKKGVYGFCAEDQTTVIINVQFVDWGDEGSEDEFPVALFMSWYKNRGRTENVYLMFDESAPRRPTAQEVIDIAKYYENKPRLEDIL